MTSDADFKVFDTIDDAQREAVYRELREHNQAANPVLWAALDRAENDARPLYVLAFDAAGLVVGGLVAETRFAWLKVSVMSVRSDLRRRDIGRRLLEAAEAEATPRGCRHAYVDTMDYQAPGFYERAGYSLAGSIDDWDSHGHAKRLFVKQLD